LHDCEYAKPHKLVKEAKKNMTKQVVVIGPPIKKKDWAKWD